MARLVTFTRQNGENEYTEFSYFMREDLSEAEMINEVYFGYDNIYDEEKGLASRKDTLSNKDDVYWFGEELVSVYRIEDITDEELDVLKKFWIV